MKHRCQNCRGPLRTRWEKALGHCRQCTMATDRYLEEKFNLVPDYQHAFFFTGREAGYNYPLIRVSPMRRKH